MIDLIFKILKVFYDNGLFHEGVELIGSWCFQLYVKHLGAKSFPLRTQDIDFLIPNPFKGKEHSDLIEQLEELGFRTAFNSDGSLYLWNAELKIEFITPETGRGVDKAIKINKLGLNAIPLRFAGFLLDKPVSVVDGQLEICLPNPANFCLHKLIIASRRKNISKSLKDIQQAVCTSTIINSDELKRLYGTLPRKWRQAIMKVLEKSHKEFPLLKSEIDKLLFTLQEVKK
ncbi:MAG: GSU2403 family nucleotidyltransferase fold protein [Candidatus Omnitrophota bacterium]